MATIKVSNVSQLMAALNNAKGVTTIELAKGNYDNLYISGNKIPELSNNSMVTITSQDAKNPASITSMILIGAKNVTFDGIDFDYSAATGANVANRAYMLLSSENITMKNSVFDGDLAKGVSSTTNGYGSGIAVGVKDTKNLTIVNNTFTDFHKAVVVERGTNVNVSNNDISGIASDGINFSAVTNGQIQNNHLHDFKSHANTSAHKDMIQIWSKGGENASKNIDIKGNILNSAAGTYTHGIMLKSENGKLHQDFVVENNLIYNAFTHGITLNNIKGAAVQNNTVLFNTDTAPDGSGLYIPRIHIGAQMQNATVNDNVTHAITGTNWSGSGNLIVQNTNPKAANYYGDLFVNALAGKNATTTDLSVLPGSVIDIKNIGALFSQPDSTKLTSSGPTALLRSQEGTELQKGTVDFDITKITDGGKPVNTSGAKVTWDFGDGSTGTGLTASHHYTHAGSYTATATVKLSDGTTIISTKSLNVKTPIILAADFEKGAGDQSDLVNGVKTSGSVSFVHDQGSKVAKLGSNGVITYARNSELYDNKAFTVMADFRKDNGNDQGKLISFANSFTIQIKDDMISASVTTDKGTKWIHTSANVDNTAWHKLALTFSGSKGSADLYLDGKIIGTIGGLKGATQIGLKNHDLHVGSNNGGSFDGLVDNVAFLAGDLSASDIKSLHSGSTTIDKLLGSALNTTGTTTTTKTATVDTSKTVTVDTTKTTTTTKTDTKVTTSSDKTAISADFESGYRDLSTKVNPVTAKGAQIVNDQGSKVVKLHDNSVLTYKDSPDLFGNKAYTVMADFRKDHKSDDGKLITFADSFVVQVKSNQLSVSVTTNKGTKWIHTKANVDDTNWHKVALTFDSGTGKATVYLDGKAIGSATGFKGATQVGNKSQDFHVGSPWGGSFDGLVDNVAFLTTDLSASEIKSIHSGTTNVPTTVVTPTVTSKPTVTPTKTDTKVTTADKTAIIAVDFEKGYADQSAKVNGVNTKNGAGIRSDQGSKVVKLADKTVVTYKDSPDMFGNKAYTVMADFRKDQKSDDGKLITFADSFVLQVKKSMLSVSVTTDYGTKWIHTDAKVDDTNWHKVALTFDSSAGKATLFLDGKAVGSVSGLKGATQVGNKSQDFHVGSPWGGSFDGLVDNVAFLNTDLSASEIKSIHAGTGTIPTGTTTTTVGGKPVKPTTTDTNIDIGGTFSYTMTAKNTKVVLDKAAKQGIIDQEYLSGDTASTFNVKVISTKSTAHLDNTLGVYEVDSKGRIVDVRILDKDAQSGGNFKVTGVDKGNDLGFFIVQDGYGRLDNSVLNSNNLSLVVKAGDVYLKKGSLVYKDKVFVSHDKRLNADNLEHVTSMDNPHDTGAIITFEDQYKGGRGNDMTDVVFEVTAVGADELSFA